MMNINSIKSKKFVNILKRNHVTYLGLCGSYARQEQDENSDIDLLVKFSKRIGLLDHIKLKRELSQLFGREVDLLTENSISPYLKDRMLKEMKVIYYDQG